MGEPSELATRRPVVVAAIPLKRAARERLSELLDATVTDVRQPVERPDVVLTPACSPQLIGLLKDRFDGAPVIVVELSDDEFDIDLTGPVTRLLDSGADAYVTADSLDELASKLAAARDTPPQPERIAHELGTATVDDIIAAFLAEPADARHHQV
ncbi:MAG TPA: hypothetical protein VNQ73_14205 [Ilumatobacter sp.]|nr:hypothetical protein [Ilumatobacter sp.]